MGLLSKDGFLGPYRLMALMLLLAFLAQAAWLVHIELAEKDSSAFGDEEVRITSGWQQWHGKGPAGAPYPNPRSAGGAAVSEDGFDVEHSPLLALVSAAPLLLIPEGLRNSSLAENWRWLARLPFLGCGLLLGASLWYVARRLCGNAGGLIALTLYCFSPALLQASASWHSEPDVVAAWGAFGAVFTAIAVGHTLYAPREVILWNGRRIVLLGVAMAIAIGAQFSMVVVVPLALALLIYVAPVRRGAGAIIWLAACAAALALLFAVYFFHGRAFLESLGRAEFWGAGWRGFAIAGVYKQVAAQIGRACPAFALALPLTLGMYLAWPRTRYFGNTAPLLAAVLMVVLAIAHPHTGGAGFLLAAAPFLFIFVAGVLVDLMETRNRALVTAGVVGMLAAYVIWSVASLLGVPRG
jgi:hypothetical protein